MIKKHRLQCALYRKIQNNFKSSHQVLALLPPSSFWSSFCITIGHWPTVLFQRLSAILTIEPGFLGGPRSLPEGIMLLRLLWCFTLCSYPAALVHHLLSSSLPLLKLLLSLQRHLLAFMFFFKIQAKMTFWEQSYWVSVITIPLCYLFSVCPVPSSLSTYNLLREKAPILHLLRASPTHWAGQLHTNT